MPKSRPEVAEVKTELRGFRRSTEKTLGELKDLIVEADEQIARRREALARSREQAKDWEKRAPRSP
ncbi:MAG: hypothetical protein K0U84_22155 [Actinomycetia bacterium]|nr:hypothetical protein [Actinomycetes bacterium]